MNTPHSFPFSFPFGGTPHLPPPEPPELTNRQYPEEPEHPALHVVIVEHDVGEVGGEEGVDAPRGADEADVRVEHRRAEGAGEHPRHVDEGDAARAVHHLERQPDQQLDHQVEAEVEPPGGRESEVMRGQNGPNGRKSKKGPLRAEQQQEISAGILITHSPICISKQRSNSTDCSGGVSSLIAGKRPRARPLSLSLSPACVTRLIPPN